MRPPRPRSREPWPSSRKAAGCSGHQPGLSGPGISPLRRGSPPAGGSWVDPCDKFRGSPRMAQREQLLPFGSSSTIFRAGLLVPPSQGDQGHAVRGPSLPATTPLPSFHGVVTSPPSWGFRPACPPPPRTSSLEPALLRTSHTSLLSQMSHQPRAAGVFLASPLPVRTATTDQQ